MEKPSMKIKVSRFIPFHGYVAITIFNVIVWRKEYESYMNNHEYLERVVNHESIHLCQIKDFCSFIPIGGIAFYLIYFIEWIARLLINGPKNAYKNISFEREAKENEINADYIETRRRFAQWRNKN